MRSCDSAVYAWYRFVLSYPPHLVQDYIKKFGINHTHKVLDPFCKTGIPTLEMFSKSIQMIYGYRNI